jgi:hypothetical protein
MRWLVVAALVARRDLGATLRAAVGLVVGVLFLAAQGASFAALVSALSDPRRLAPLGAVLEGHFGGTLLHWTLQLAVVSLIAMRTIAEDRRAGTWEVLLTAPVRESEAVVGKWLAAVAFYALLWLPTLAYLVVLAVYSPPDARIDPGPVAAAYAGEIAIGAAFLAVGVAWSAATASQIVAGIGTFATLLGLLLVGEAPSLGADLPWAAALSPRAHLAAFARGEIAAGRHRRPDHHRPVGRHRARRRRPPPRRRDGQPRHRDRAGAGHRRAGDRGRDPPPAGDRRQPRRPQLARRRRARGAGPRRRRRRDPDRAAELRRGRSGLRGGRAAGRPHGPRAAVPAGAPGRSGRRDHHRRRRP